MSYLGSLKIEHVSYDIFIWYLLFLLCREWEGRGDHFRFGSVFTYKKQPSRFFFEKKLKPNRNWVKPIGFGPVRFGSWFQKTKKTYTLIFLLKLASSLFTNIVSLHCANYKQPKAKNQHHWFQLKNNNKINIPNPKLCYKSKS